MCACVCTRVCVGVVSNLMQLSLIMSVRLLDLIEITGCSAQGQAHYGSGVIGIIFITLTSCSQLRLPSGITWGALKLLWPWLFSPIICFNWWRCGLGDSNVQLGWRNRTTSDGDTKGLWEGRAMFRLAVQNAGCRLRTK